MARIAKQTYYMTADRSRLVAEDDAEAAFLFVRKGGTINEADAKRYGFGDLDTRYATAYDAKADHEAKHGGETEEQAAAAQQRMLEGQPDPDGPPVEGERGNLDETAADAPPDTKAADAPPDTKAVTKAPANKSAAKE